MAPSHWMRVKVSPANPTVVRRLAESHLWGPTSRTRVRNPQHAEEWAGYPLVKIAKKEMAPLSQGPCVGGREGGREWGRRGAGVGCIRRVALKKKKGLRSDIGHHFGPLCVRRYLYLCVCVALCVCRSVCVALCVCRSVCVSLCVRRSACCRSVCLCALRSVCVLERLFVLLPVPAEQSEFRLLLSSVIGPHRL